MYPVFKLKKRKSFWWFAKCVHLFNNANYRSCQTLLLKNLMMLIWPEVGVAWKISSKTTLSRDKLVFEAGVNWQPRCFIRQLNFLQLLLGYNKNTRQKKLRRCKGSVSHLIQSLCQCVSNVRPVLKHSCGAWRLCLCWLFLVSSTLEACLIMNGFRHDHFQTAGVVFFYFAASSAWMKPKTLLGELFSLFNLPHKGNHREYINGSYRDYSLDAAMRNAMPCLSE